MIERPSLGSGAPSRRRVLLVDDDALVLRSVARILRREFDVVTAANAPDAITRIGADLRAVITDHDLGAGPDGRAVLVKARLRAPNARRILMSGRLQTARAGEEELWHAFLAKPVSRADLLAALGVIDDVAERLEGARRRRRRQVGTG